MGRAVLVSAARPILRTAASCISTKGSAVPPKRIISPLQNQTQAAQNPSQPSVQIHATTSGSGPSPLYPDDTNYNGVIYEVTWPGVVGDIRQTYAALVSLRAQISLMGPKPTYTIHGHHMEFEQLLARINDTILQLKKELISLSPSDTSISAAR